MPAGPVERREIAIVGGGVSVASLVEALVARPELPPLRIRLSARRHERTAVIARHLARGGWYELPQAERRRRFLNEE